MVFDRRQIGVRRVVSAALRRRHDGIEVHRVKVAIIDLVTGLYERLDDGSVQRGGKAVG
jgi:hypothetical protein